MNFYRPFINKKARLEMSFIMYHDPGGALAAIFSSMPLPLKQHCIKVGAVAGMMAERAPESAIPEGMTRQDYANAVRYGGFYHDIGAYLRYNQWAEYPAAGKSILEKEISPRVVCDPIRRVILETVGCFGERFDGAGRQIPFHAGVCAIADAVDMIAGGRKIFLTSAIQSAKKYIREQTGVIFLPDAAAGFSAAEDAIFALYRSWKISPPMWKYNDLKPIYRAYKTVIG